MPNLFKQLKFGLAPVTITPEKLAAREQVLISYIKTCCSNSAQYDVEACVEVFNIAKEFIGQDFKLWIIANYKNGAGARAPLCKAITHWVSGKAHGRTVVETLRRDLDRLNFLKNNEEQVQTPITHHLKTKHMGDYAGEEHVRSNIDFNVIKDRHFFEFLALLGPELTAHFCLSLDGIRYK